MRIINYRAVYLPSVISIPGNQGTLNPEVIPFSDVDLINTVLQRGLGEQRVLPKPFQWFFFALAGKPLKHLVDIQSVAFT